MVNLISSNVFSVILFVPPHFLAHCRPRSCGRQRAKAIAQQKDMPKAIAP